MVAKTRPLHDYIHGQADISLGPKAGAAATTALGFISTVATGAAPTAPGSLSTVATAAATTLGASIAVERTCVMLTHAQEKRRVNRL
jgi:hypothetical protein